MAYNTAAKAYGNNRIETATPAELTLMLYEGAVKFCNIAIVGLEKNDYDPEMPEYYRGTDIDAEYEISGCRGLQAYV